MAKVTIYDTDMGHTLEVDEATATFLLASDRFRIPKDDDPVPAPDAPPAVSVDPALHEAVDQRS